MPPQTYYPYAESHCAFWSVLIEKPSHHRELIQSLFSGLPLLSPSSLRHIRLNVELFICKVHINRNLLNTIFLKNCFM